MPTVYVPADRLVETCRALRDTSSLQFTALIEVTAADYFPREPRYEVVYHLLSIPNRARLRVKVRVPGGGSVPTVPIAKFEDLDTYRKWYAEQMQKFGRWGRPGMPGGPPAVGDPPPPKFDDKAPADKKVEPEKPKSN